MKFDPRLPVSEQVYGIVVLLVVLLLSAQAEAQSLFGKKWVLTEIEGSGVSTTRAYIEFDGNTKRISCDGGCNRFAGNFEINGAKIKFSQTLSTKRACMDQAIQQVENDFLSGLPQVTGFRIQGNVLRLNALRRTILAFRSGSSGTSTPQEAHVTGTVSYRQRIALPARAIVTVRLLDVSRADAPSVTIVEQVIHPDGGQAPFAFDLIYDPGAINQRGRYAVQARIENRGRLLFINSRAYPVITNSHPNTVNVIVQPVRR
jgi:putative lipoprotein